MVNETPEDKMRKKVEAAEAGNRKWGDIPETTPIKKPASASQKKEPKPQIQRDNSGAIAKFKKELKSLILSSGQQKDWRKTANEIAEIIEMSDLNAQRKRINANQAKFPEHYDLFRELQRVYLSGFSKNEILGILGHTTTGIGFEGKRIAEEKYRDFEKARKTAENNLPKKKRPGQGVRRR